MSSDDDRPVPDPRDPKQREYDARADPAAGHQHGRVAQRRPVLPLGHPPRHPQAQQADRARRRPAGRDPSRCAPCPDPGGPGRAARAHRPGRRDARVRGEGHGRTGGGGGRPPWARALPQQPRRRRRPLRPRHAGTGRVATRPRSRTSPRCGRSSRPRAAQPSGGRHRVPARAGQRRPPRRRDRHRRCTDRRDDGFLDGVADVEERGGPRSTRSTCSRSPTRTTRRTTARTATGCSTSAPGTAPSSSAWCSRWRRTPGVRLPGDRQRRRRQRGRRRPRHAPGRRRRRAGDQPLAGGADPRRPAAARDGGRARADRPGRRRGRRGRGNDGDDRPRFPAAQSGVVAVAALSSRDPAERAPAAAARWSSRGYWVDCSAVGEGIVSTYVPGKEEHVPRHDAGGVFPRSRTPGASGAARPSRAAGRRRGRADHGGAAGRRPLPR